LKGLQECGADIDFLQTFGKLAALTRDVAPDSHAENLKIWEAMNSTDDAEHEEAIERCKAEIAAFKLQISKVTSEIDKQQGNLIACASSDVALLLLAKF
jgi:hypothetical protein